MDEHANQGLTESMKAERYLARQRMEAQRRREDRQILGLTALVASAGAGVALVASLWLHPALLSGAVVAAATAGVFLAATETGEG